mmetsp:Transcript_25837/g.55597  ORF Transcript_25837/g.55597 Transcript_25837/m.55597 type:complete len:264 (-) Transcript_25837:840-1631(-)
MHDFYDMALPSKVDHGCVAVLKHQLSRNMGNPTVNMQLVKCCGEEPMDKTEAPSNDHHNNFGIIEKDSTIFIWLPIGGFWTEFTVVKEPSTKGKKFHPKPPSKLSTKGKQGNPKKKGNDLKRKGGSIVSSQPPKKAVTEKGESPSLPKPVAAESPLGHTFDFDAVVMNMETPSGFEFDSALMVGTIMTENEYVTFDFPSPPNQNDESVCESQDDGSIFTLGVNGGGDVNGDAVMTGARESRFSAVLEDEETINLPLSHPIELV